MMRRLYLLLPVLIAVLFQPLANAGNDKPVRVKMATDYGNITLELYPDKAPATVKNFLRYTNEKYYNDTIFHRVIKGFMIQGGGLTSDYKKKTTHDPVKNESDNGLSNQRGTIAMARTNNPHSATSQFFINSVDNSRLDYKTASKSWGYTVFGKVINGMDVVDKISEVPTGPAGPFRSDAPQGMISIKEISLVNDAKKKPKPKSKKKES